MEQQLRQGQMIYWMMPLNLIHLMMLLIILVSSLSFCSTQLQFVLSEDTCLPKLDSLIRIEEKLNICMLYRKTVRLVDTLRSDYDTEVHKWRQSSVSNQKSVKIRVKYPYHV